MTYALITVFFPSEDTKQNVQKIAKQVDRVFICDNSPYSNQEMFETMEISDRICYVFLGENLGLSCAFNKVLKEPVFGWEDNDYIIFFDQDSTISSHHIDALIAVYEQVQDVGVDIGCLGPVFYNSSSGNVEVPRMKKAVLKNTYAVSGIITSSMLCRYSELKKIGFWNEEIFLDMADWDLCWRLQKIGKQCCVTEAVILRHRVGSGEKKIGPFKLRIGAPVREYYQIRDSLYLLQKEYTPIKYRVRFLAMLAVRSPLHIIFLENRIERMRYILKGVSDYHGRRHGALPSQKERLPQMSR